MPTFNETLRLLIEADGRGAVRELKHVGDTAQRELDRAGKHTRDWGSTFVRTGALVAGGAAIMGVGLFKAAMAHEEAHLAELKLQNSLKNNPRLAGASTESFLRLAQSIQSVTAADGDEVVAGMAMLGTFRVTEDELRRITPLVVDYARKFGVDLVSANAQVGKALDGSVGALKRNGVTIDEVMFKTDRFGAVMGALRGQVGGFAEREGKTFAGQMERLRNETGDVVEAIGGGVVNAIQKVMPAVRGGIDVFKGLDDATGGTVGELLTFGTVGAGTVGVLLLMSGAALKVKHVMEGFSTAFPRTAAIAGPLLKGTLAFGGFVTVAYAALDALGAFDKITSGVNLSVERLQSSRGLAGVRRELGELVESQRWINEETENYPTVEMANNALYTSIGVLGGKYDDLADSFRKIARQSPEAAQAFIDQAVAVGVSGKELERLRRIYDRAVVTNSELASATYNSAQSLVEQGRAADLTAEQMTSLVGATLAKWRADLGLEGALLNLRGAQERYNEALTDPSASPLDRANAENQLTNSYVAVAEAARAKAEHDLGPGADGNEKQVAGTKAMIDTLTYLAAGLAPGSPLRAALRGYILDLQASAGDYVANLILKVPGNFRMTKFGPVVNFGFGEVGFTVSNGRIVVNAPGRAAGGPVSGGHMYETHGLGSREFFMPGQDGQIVPKSSLAGSIPVTGIGGGGRVTNVTNITVEGSVVTLDELADLVVDRTLSRERKGRATQVRR